MKIGSLCTGYGGLDLAVEAVTGGQTIWYSEFDKHVSKIMEYHRPNLTNYGDLTKIDWQTMPPVDILTAGYPCQPFSAAGQRKGINDPRHIWPHIATAISILRPKLVVLENVRGHLSLGFDEVLKTLTQIGYDAKWEIIRASDIGAPHQRARLFIIAYPQSSRRRPQQDRQKSSPSEAKNGLGIIDKSDIGFAFDPNNREPIWEMQKPWWGFVARSDMRMPEKTKSVVADTMQQGLQGGKIKSCQPPTIVDRNITQGAISFGNWGKYEPAIKRWEQATRLAPNPITDERLEPKFVEWLMGLDEGWVTNTNLSRSQQLKALGNGVVPQQAAYALNLLLNK
jgi:DNA (cytosine-5)-methyltransferase 1